MILADTSVWIDHLRRTDVLLADRLDRGEIIVHPFVIGELALGSLRGRDAILKSLGKLPRAQTAKDVEVLGMIDHHRLFGLGIGFVDAHLLAATLLTDDGRLWTRDRRLRDAAHQMRIAAHEGH